MKSSLALIFGAALVLTSAEPAALAAPGEATGLIWCAASKSCLQWNSVPAATQYGLHRGVRAQLPLLLTAGVDSCDRYAHAPGISAVGLSENPAPGTMFWYLVIAEDACGQGPAGNATAGARIVNTAGQCEPACADAAVDGLETDVDCGGGTCLGCANGKLCFGGSDCASRRCVLGHCSTPACNDGIGNGSETGVDCGGACVPCSNGQGCCAGSDCQSATCSGDSCVLPPCLNGTQDGTETDVDCGGGTCPPCAIGKHCVFGSDCTSLVCSPVTHICQAPTCSDGVRNGTETDVDCGGGGPGCPGCANGKMCIGGADCQSGNCTAGICQPTLPNGSACTSNPQCASAHCVDGVCCNTTCANLCQACTAVKKGSGTDGTCGNISNGTDPDNECAGSATCNGSGACSSPNGAPCAVDANCQSGNCVDGVCCNTACNGLCQACTAVKKGSGADGTCGNIGGGLDPDNECAGSAVCNGSGSCANPNGTACILGSSCVSGNCVDGFCCNTTCNALCQACSAVKQGGGTNGTCGNIANGLDPDNECAGTLNCNGAGACGP